MTIVEVVAAVTILAAISWVLTESVIQALVTADDTARRFGESIDVEVLADAFPPDVHSAQEVWAPAGGFEDACSPGPPPVLRLRWTDGPVTQVTTYTLVLPGGDERHLVRRSCRADSLAGDSSLRLVHEQVVARFVAAGVPEPVVVSCQPGPPCPARPWTVTLEVTGASGSVLRLTGLRRAP